MTKKVWTDSANIEGLVSETFRMYGTNSVRLTDFLERASDGVDDRANEVIGRIRNEIVITNMNVENKIFFEKDSFRVEVRFYMIPEGYPKNKVQIELALKGLGFGMK